MLPATSENTSTAIAYVNMLEAGGGTNIHEALVAALNQLKGDDYLNMVLFMTDGIATVGVTENEEILKEVQTRNALAARIFAFGVGFDVNTHLLDLLGSQNRGTSAYVKPGEDIEAEVSAFYTQVSHPVLSKLKLTYDGISDKRYVSTGTAGSVQGVTDCSVWAVCRKRRQRLSSSRARPMEKG